MDQELRVLRHANQNLEKRCVKDQVDSHNLPADQKLWGKNLASIINIILILHKYFESRKSMNDRDILLL